MVYAVLGLQWVVWRIAGFTAIQFQAACKSDLYQKCFKYLHGHSATFFNNNFVGSLVRRINKYDRAYEDITDQLFWNLIPAISLLALILFQLWRTNVKIALLFTGWTIFYLIFTTVFSVKSMKFDLKVNELDSKTTGFVADTITNQSNVKLFASLGFELGSFNKLVVQWKNSLVTAWNVHTIQEAIQSALMIGGDFVIVYTSIKLWSQGALTVGEVVMIQAFMIRVFDRLWEIGRNIRRLYQGFAEANEMTEILLTPHEVLDVKEAKNLTVKSGKIEFQKVFFGYKANQNIFRNFSLSIEPGQKLALVGPSGGGKSTIVKLLLRFLDIESGVISIDNQNIAEVTQDSLRTKVSLVPQDPVLFHRSLFDNIQYGNPKATKDQVIKASKLAHCHEFISRLPDSYHTFVGERGIKLSGGERQRVAIARAILKDAPILVLDEATSSLDSESELLIQDALKNLMKDKTVIVIAHRLSTIMQMDRIVVIEKGKIKESGTHNELVELSDGAYQKLWNIQVGGFQQK